MGVCNCQRPRDLPKSIYITVKMAQRLNSCIMCGGRGGDACCQ